MRPIALVLLAGCAPEPFDAPPVGPLDPWLSELAPDVPERTRTLGEARGRLSPDGPPLAGDPWRVRQDLLVAEIGERLGVIWEGRSVRVGLWLDRDDLVTAPVDPTWTGGDRGVRLPAGLPVEVLDVEGGRARVAATNGVVAVDGWMRAADLDQFWVEQDAPPWERGEGPPLRVAPGAELLDGPSGDRVGFVEPDGDAEVLASEVERRRGHARVRFDAGGWPVDAWVHEDDVSTGHFGAWRIGRSWSGGAWCGTGPEPDVRAGALLRDGPDGPVVARVFHDLWMGVEDGPGGPEAELLTPFGAAIVSVDPADVLR